MIACRVAWTSPKASGTLEATFATEALAEERALDWTRFMAIMAPEMETDFTVQVEEVPA
jgi:hypothetical protein